MSPPLFQGFMWLKWVDPGVGTNIDLNIKILSNKARSEKHWISVLNRRTDKTTMPKIKKHIVGIYTKRMLTFEDLSFYIGLSSQTIRNKFYAGEFPIPAKRIFSKVLWDKKDVDKYLDKLQKIDC